MPPTRFVFVNRSTDTPGTQWHDPAFSYSVPRWSFSWVPLPASRRGLAQLIPSEAPPGSCKTVRPQAETLYYECAAYEPD